MSAIVLTSSEPGAGKTTLATGLLQWLRRQQRSATYRRLDGPGAPEDAAFVAGALGRLAEGSSVPVAAALAPDESTRVLIEASSLDDARVLVSRGATPLILVSYRSDGLAESIHVALGALGAPRPLVVINPVPEKGGREVRQKVLPELANAAVVLGSISEDPVLRGLSVGDLARALDAAVLTAPDQLELPIEAVMVTAMSDEGAEEYFRRRARKAVVCSGDRPDVQLPALATDTSCIVLTEGYDPDPTVFEAAEEQGVPLLKVRPSTTETLERISDALAAARFRQRSKLPRALSLVSEQLDLRSLLAALDAVPGVR